MSRRDQLLKGANIHFVLKFEIIVVWNLPYISHRNIILVYLYGMFTEDSID